MKYRATSMEKVYNVQKKLLIQNGELINKEFEIKRYILKVYSL